MKFIDRFRVSNDGTKDIFEMEVSPVDAVKMNVEVEMEAEAIAPTPLVMKRKRDRPKIGRLRGRPHNSWRWPRVLDGVKEIVDEHLQAEGYGTHQPWHWDQIGRWKKHHRDDPSKIPWGSIGSLQDGTIASHGLNFSTNPHIEFSNPPSSWIEEAIPRERNKEHLTLTKPHQITHAFACVNEARYNVCS